MSLPVKRVPSASVARQPSSVIQLGDEDELSHTSTNESLKDTLADIQRFSQSSSISNMTSEIEMQKRIGKFETKISAILEQVKKLKIDDDAHLQEVFLFVLQACEDYIYCSDREKCKKIKSAVCIKLLKSFTKDDEALCRCFMSVVQSNVKPSTFMRRNKKAILKFVRFFLSLLGRSI